MKFYHKNRQLSTTLKFAGLLVLLISFISFSAHKYYVSITKIEVDSEEKLFKMYTHVFIDDFEQLLNERYQLKVKDFSKISSLEKQQIAQYINRKITITVNRKPLKISFLGCQLENELLYLFYEAPYTESVKRLDIENTLLMDLFTTQQNSVDVSFNNKVKRVHLTSQNKKQTLFF